jgi:hypothetical protein
MRWLTELGKDLIDRLINVIRRIRRIQPGPALMRLAAGAAAMGALLVAAPAAAAQSSQAGLLVPFAIVVVFFPRTRWVGIAALVSVLLWLLATIADDGPPPLWRLGALAGILYVMHSAAAVAAVLPYDAVVAGRVLLRWAARTIAVTAVSVAIGLGGYAVVDRLPTQRSIIGPIVGAVLAAMLVGMLALQLRRAGTIDRDGTG